MGPLPNNLGVIREEEWEIIPANWWHISFGSVSWSYFEKDHMNPQSNYSKPPHYHESLFCAPLVHEPPDTSQEPDLGCAESEISLNQDLVGVLGAEDVLINYEVNEGFHYSDPPKLHEKCGTKAVEGSNMVSSKNDWSVLMEKLFGGVAEEEVRSFRDYADEGKSRDSGSSSSFDGLEHNALYSTKSNDSDPSVDSISAPSTPKTNSSEATVEVKNVSPVGGDEFYSVAPSRPLNAHASSFIPSFIKPTETGSAPFRPPTTTNFNFPSLDAPTLPTVKIRKDENGFYSEVETMPSAIPPSRPSSALLPPFLQERRRAPVSKTRAMVEHLRSSNQSYINSEISVDKNTSLTLRSAPPLRNFTSLKNSPISDDSQSHGSGVSSPSTLDEDEDGWINAVEDEISNESKTKRTRDLFLALTRRRSDSLPPIQPTAYKETIGDIGDVEIYTTSSLSPSPSPSSNDAWIEGLSTLPKVRKRTRTESHSRPGRKGRPSNIPRVTPTPVPIPTKPHSSIHPFQASYHIPNPYFYAAYHSLMTPMTYASYMQMQFQAQMHMREAECHTSILRG